MPSGVRDVLFETVKALEHRAAALQEIARFARFTGGQEEMVAELLRKVMELVGADAGAVALARPDTGAFDFVTAQWASLSKMEAAQREKILKLIRVNLSDGVIGQVHASGEPVIVPDLAKSSSFRKDVSETVKYEIQNILAVPLIMDDARLGVLELFNKRPKGTFSSQDLDLAVALGHQIALILEVHRLRGEGSAAQAKADVPAAPSPAPGGVRPLPAENEAQIQELKQTLATAQVVQEKNGARIRELTEELERARGVAEAQTPAEQMVSLLRSVEPIAFSLSPEVILKSLSEMSLRLLEVEAVRIFLWDGVQDSLVLSQGTVAAEDGRAVSAKKGQGIVGTVAETMDVVISNDVAKDKRFAPDVDQPPGVKAVSALAIPMAIEGRLYGVAQALNRKTGVFYEDNVLHFLSLAFCGAMALEKSRLHLEGIGTLRSILSALSDGVHARGAGSPGRHERLRRMAVLLGKTLGLREEELKDLELAALVYDVGEITLPAATSSAVPSKEDQETLKESPRVAGDIFAGVPGLEGVVQVVRHVQERWDGTGHPEKLVRVDIPMGSRVIALVDTFDGLASGRFGRRGIPEDQAVKELSDLSGKVFDPACVETFSLLWKNGKMKKAFRPGP